MRRKLVAAIAAIGVAGVTASAAPFIWIEGESAIKTNLQTNSWVKGDNPKLLSGGDAFACINERDNLPKPAFATWEFQVEEPGTYHLYIRHAWKGHCGESRYRFIKLGDDGKPVKPPAPDEGFTAFDLDSPVMDQKPNGQHRSVEWSRCDPVELEKGKYFFNLQITGPNPGKVKEANPPIWTMIDCICLSKEPFTPNGYVKPGEKAAAGAAAPAGGDGY